MSDAPDSPAVPPRGTGPGQPHADGAAAGVSTGRMVASAVVMVALVGAAWWLLGPDGGTVAGTDAGSGKGAGPPATTAGTARAPAAAAVPVEIALARRGELVMRITATGNAEATRLLEIEAATEGVLEELPVAEGDIVEAGHLLARLDDTELRLELERSREQFVRAMAAFAEKQAFLEEDALGSGSLQELQSAWQGLLEGMISHQEFADTVEKIRFDDLFATISRDEVMAAQDSLFTAKANYQQAAMRLERASVRAPFGGQLGLVRVVEGARVSPATPLMTLVDADPIRLRAEVLESEAGLVQRGRTARVRFAAYPDRTFQGRVETISPTVDPETKTLEVIVSLPNPELRLKPGMFAQITLDARIFQDRLLVPADAVLVRDDRPLVFVVEEGRARWVYVETGLRNDDWVEILDGVEPGDPVIVDGHYTLAHDSAVRVVEDADAAGADAEG